MKRYLVEVYEVEIPENGIRRDDLVEATEDWLVKYGKEKCFLYQLQGESLQEIGEFLS